MARNGVEFLEDGMAAQPFQHEAGFLNRGASRHEAIHVIAYEFNMELFTMLKHSRPFDNPAYERRLEKVARGKK